MTDRVIRIKVCGMRETENIKQLVALKPDFIGFILFPGSIRYVGDNFQLKTELPETIQRVGVFVNALIEDVIHWVNQLALNYIQLHGVESADYCQELSDIKLHVIKAFSISETFDFSTLQAYRTCCDYFLFDTKSQLHGGSGIKFNWDHLDDYNLDLPFFLSGGIGHDDAAEVLSLKNKLPLYAVDINSQFEIAPGIKDIELLRQFFSTIRR